MTAVGTYREEFTPAQLQDAEFLREFAVACLAPPELSSASPLADRFVRTRRKPIAQGSPSVTYTVDGDEYRRGAIGRWASQVHATATRPASYSRPLAWGSPRYVAAIWRLNSLHICSILARYSHSPSQRANSRNRLANRVAAQFRTATTKQRARVATHTLLAGGTAETVRKVLGIEKAQWRASHGRKTVYAVDDYLQKLDVESLLAWRAGWSKSRGRE